MKNITEVLQSLEKTTMVIEDTELRKVAFQELLRNAIHGHEEGEYRQPKRRVAAESRPRRRASSGARESGVAVRTEVANLDLSPDESGLVTWGSLGTDWKKFCWILEASRLRGVDGLTNSEISYLIEKVFRESFPAKLVNNLKKKIKGGMVKTVVVRSGDKEYAVWKILSAGSKDVSVKLLAETVANAPKG